MPNPSSLDLAALRAAYADGLSPVDTVEHVLTRIAAGHEHEAVLLLAAVARPQRRRQRHHAGHRRTGLGRHENLWTQMFGG